MTTWRDIQKNNHRAGKTRAARQRRLKVIFKSTLFLLVFLSVGTGVVGMMYFKKDFKSVESQLVKSSKSQITLSFETDGVLGRDWAQEIMEEFLYADVRALDLDEIKLKIESFGQVKEARVQVELPENLRVSVQERDPVLRVRVKDKSQGAKTLLIARDGTVYEGVNYPKESLRRLPGALGLTLKKDGGEWMPISGMPEIADFLDDARFKVPSLYRHWKLVDLSNWSSEESLNSDLIQVSSGSKSEIIFSVHQFSRQLTRLAQIVNHSQRYQMGFPSKIDLSFGEEAVIDY